MSTLASHIGVRSVLKPAFEDRQMIESDRKITLEIFDCEPAFERFDPANEAKGKTKRLGRLTYEMEVADKLNQNRRVYPSSVMAEAVAAMQPRLERNQVFGRLDHPHPWDWEGTHVRFSDAAIKIVEVKMVTETKMKVVVDILDNEHGRQLISVKESGGNPGISQRAMAEWRDMDSSDKERWGVPEDEFAVVAESLRLITFDIVSEPGFVDAHSPDASESREHRKSEMTPEEFKSKHPAAYNTILQEGMTLGKGNVEEQIKTALEAKKPELVAEAVKTANEARDNAVKQLEAAKATLEQVKPVMVSLGLVNEKITDVEAAKAVASSEAKATAVTAERDAVQKELAAVKAKITAFEQREQQFAAAKAAYDKYATHEHRSDIMQIVVARKPATADEAIKIADEHAALIEKYAGKAGDGAQPNGQTNSTTPGMFNLEQMFAPANPGQSNAGSSDAGKENASEGDFSRLLLTGAW